VRKIVLWLASTVTVVVLLFSYHTSTNSAATAPASTAGSQPTSSAGSGSGSGAGGNGSGGSPVPTPTASAAPSASTPSSSGQGSGTYTGAVAQTRWGPVQVQLTVADRKVTAVEVVEYPTENRHDQEINAVAIPELVQETLAAQSAGIDMVSGATVTSEGYLQSLQSALDQAGI
jgi:uncharacterized protein with FMN-binding domain